MQNELPLYQRHTTMYTLDIGARLARPGGMGTSGATIDATRMKSTLVRMKNRRGRRDGATDRPAPSSLLPMLLRLKKNALVALFSGLPNDFHQIFMIPHQFLP